LTPHRWRGLRWELHWILSAKMRREASLALTEGPLTVTARPSVSSERGFTESWRFGSRRSLQLSVKTLFPVVLGLPGASCWWSRK
jgi:hypothetical protein